MTNALVTLTTGMLYLFDDEMDANKQISESKIRFHRGFSHKLICILQEYVCHLALRPTGLNE